MARLDQNQSNYLIYYGWYGTCPEESTAKCIPFDLVTIDAGDSNNNVYNHK